MRAMNGATLPARRAAAIRAAALCAWLAGALAAQGASAQGDIWYGESAVDTAFVLGLGASLGGEEFDHPNDASNTDVSLGQGVSVFAGILQPIAPLGIDFALNVGAQGQVHEENSDLGDADVRQSHVFVEAAALWRIGKKHSFGFGGIRHFSPETTIERGDRRYEAKFLDANGGFAEYRYVLRSDAVSAYKLNIAFSLRYTLMDYVVDTVDAAPTLPDGFSREYQADQFHLRVQLLF